MPIQPTSLDELKNIVQEQMKSYGPHVDLNHMDVSRITSMGGLFRNSPFNGDISKWDVSHVTDMNHMFYYSAFKGDISQWNVSNVKDMRWMFEHSEFSGDISQWDVRNVQAFGRFISPNANIAIPLRFMWHLPSLFHEHTRDIDTYLQGLAPGVLLPAHTQRVLQSHQKLSYVSDEFFQFVKQAQGQMKSLGLSIQAMSHQIHAAWEVR